VDLRKEARELMKGAIDIHTHTAPSMFNRPYHDFDLASLALKAGYRAVLLKAHESTSVFRAQLTQRHLENGIDVFGGLVLNAFVGGFNPYAVDLSAKLGAKMIWMPTITSQHHYDFYGAPQYGSMKSDSAPLSPKKGLTILDEDSKIKDSVLEVLQIIAEHDICLGTGHLSNPEIMILCDKAIELGVKKIAVTHADFELIALPLEDQISLAQKGVYIEKSLLPMMPMWHSITPKETADSIRSIGASQCVLETDFGQIHHPDHIQGMELFVVTLLEVGITPEEIRKMLVENPQRLMGVYEGPE
jgi:hypothetical protein